MGLLAAREDPVIISQHGEKCRFGRWYKGFVHVRGSNGATWLEDVNNCFKLFLHGEARKGT